MQAEPGPVPFQHSCMSSMQTEQFGARQGVKELKASFYCQQGSEPVAGGAQGGPGV